MDIHSEDPVADKKREKPGSAIKVVKSAKKLNDEDRVQEALSLLLERRPDFRNVPPAYDAAIGRLYVRQGNHEAGVDYLLRSRDGFDGDVPTDLRRDLAKAMLAVGRVEAAGSVLSELLAEADAAKRKRPSWASRNACLAAIDAFNDRGNKKLDVGPPTPLRILAQSEVMIELDDRDGALALLRKHSDDWATIPDSYKSAMAKLALKTRDKQARIVRLAEKRDANPDAVPAKKRVRLGTKLFEVGRVTEAGQELSLAVDGGEEIGRLDLAIATDSYRRAHGHPEGYETSFGESFTLVNPDKRLVYVPIAKNACTLLKTNFVLNSSHREEFLAGKTPIHGFCDRLSSPVPRQEFLGPGYFRFVVLRDPARRLVSAYLNKVVRLRRPGQAYRRIPLMDHTIRVAQQAAGIEYDPMRSISFEEFVRFLSRVEDYECNRHWMPQFRFVGTDLSLYHHVGKLESLQATLDLLSEKFGFATETQHSSGPIGGARHAAKYNDEAALEAPYAALPRELDAFEDKMPSPDRFYTTELRQLVEERFAADFALYRAA